MKGTVLLFACTLLGADSAPDMLEKALPGVVMIEVGKASQEIDVRGLVTSDAAYEKILDLSGAESSGSGFVIERGGVKYVVTNAHVVEMAAGPKAIKVYSLNRTPYEVTLSALDSLYDLAVLRFNDAPGPEISALTFRAGTVRIGETVYAIGNPISKYPYTVTVGIIGGKNRRFPGLTGKFGFLQSSAPTSVGNSGGPLIGSDGAVVGINSMIGAYMEDRVKYYPAQLNFALEAGIASKIIDQMLANGGRLNRAYLGLEITEDFDLKERPLKGAAPILTATLPGSPAAEACVGKVGYVVRKINRTEVEDPDDALEAFEQVRSGQMVRLELSAPGTDRIDVVNLKADGLTDEHAATIGNYLLEHYTAAMTVEKDGAVLIEPGSKPVLSVKAGMRVRMVSLGPRDVTSVPKDTPVIAAGLDTDSLYRVRNERDLGIATKISAMAGEVHYYINVKGSAEPKKVPLWLSGKPDVMQRTLFY